MLERNNIISLWVGKHGDKVEELLLAMCRRHDKGMTRSIKLPDGFSRAKSQLVVSDSDWRPHFYERDPDTKLADGDGILELASSLGNPNVGPEFGVAFVEYPMLKLLLRSRKWTESQPIQVIHSKRHLANRLTTTRWMPPADKCASCPQVLSCKTKGL